MAWILVLLKCKPEVQNKCRRHQVLFSRRLKLPLDGLVAGPIMVSLWEVFYKSSPSCDVHIVPDDPSLRASGSPLNSSWLQRLSLGHPTLLPGGLCLAHIQTPMCPHGWAFGDNLGKELQWFYLLDITTATDGIVHGCMRSQVYPQACKYIWRAHAKLLLGMPAALPYNEAQWYSCITWLFVTEGTVHNK